MEANKGKVSEVIMQTTAEHKASFDEHLIKFNIFSTNVVEKLNELTTAIQMLQASKKSSGTKKTTSTGTPTENKPLSNSMYWFKKIWIENTDATLEEYCNKEIKNAVKEFNNSELGKSKSGKALKEAQVKYIWPKYIKDNELLKGKITRHYKLYVEEFKKKSMTPVNKDSETAKPKKSTTTQKDKPKKTVKKDKNEKSEEEKSDGEEPTKNEESEEETENNVPKKELNDSDSDSAEE